MRRAERYLCVLNHFRMTMPEVTTELHFESVFQLLVATMLSAQCTDKRVNMVTPALFQAYPDAQSMANASESDILRFISTVSYPNSKARHLKQMAEMLVKNYNGEVPTDFNELLKLPGVGRKTANVIEAVAYNRASMPVDTHVFRVSHRLGLVSKSATTPYHVEQELKKNIPDEDMARAHHWLLLHGRYVCTSRKAHCEKCPFDSFCPKSLVTK